MFFFCRTGAPDGHNVESMRNLLRQNVKNPDDYGPRPARPHDAGNASRFPPMSLSPTHVHPREMFQPMSPLDPCSTPVKSRGIFSHQSLLQVSPHPKTGVYFVKKIQSYYRQVTQNRSPSQNINVHMVPVQCMFMVLLPECSFCFNVENIEPIVTH